MRTTCLLFLILGMWTCPAQQDRDRILEEIRSAEEAFYSYAREAGLKAAFLEFADANASIVRNNEVITGKEAIANYFDKGDYSKVSLKWKPDFIDVSASGDLGYTFGTYEWSATGPDGKTSVQNGIFHTVWKRQEDGSWKYVYD